ncbi:type VI secretion system-associated FHA domain protein TagH [Pseudomonas xanthosomatis]|uniref:type VI secretion system-associated FHA domain protein TagH n=1 Tax=Pseudomonas xanthosomatis TaxID=2842356 RepID=UPI001C3E62E4|nr:type VI secretion system-associated FHA domain protein TagH [Pseudomonas xanthosomatis]QXH44751.1 type VI secretion system-associated FHA domain protein TagH [Pseudomonas xanthosomatis]
MELVLEIQNTRQLIPQHARTCLFGADGGTIGRASDCEWTIPDGKKHLSGHHARVSCERGVFYLTDLSRNGVFTGSGVQLPRGEPFRIEHDSVFRLCDFEIRARLVREPARFDGEIGRPTAAGSIIPDDAFLDLDPLNAFKAPAGADDAFASAWREPAQRSDAARIDTENLIVPELVPEPVAAPVYEAPAPRGEGVSEQFWARFGQALGIDLQALDGPAREALAVKAAGLLNQSIAGLQQSLRTRSDLKNELRLGHTTAQQSSRNPLRQAGDSGQALRLMLQPGQAGQGSAEQALARGFRDLQAHQVALLAGSRAVVHSTLEHFTPSQLSLRFERERGKPLVATSGSRWRAFQRYHQALSLDDDFVERLLARDFAQAYEEQVRLIATLHSEHEG